MFKQEVWYDWVPEYCEECLQVGHDCRLKYGKPPPEKKEKQVVKRVKQVANKQ